MFSRSLPGSASAVTQGAKVRHRQGQRGRLGQEEVAKGRVREAREVFQLLERRLGIAAEPQGPLAKARRQLVIVQARALRRPAQHGDGSSHGGHVFSSGARADASRAKPEPAASSLTVIGG